jgi:hypothetical protein
LCGRLWCLVVWIGGWYNIETGLGLKLNSSVDKDERQWVGWLFCAKSVVVNAMT